MAASNNNNINLERLVQNVVSLAEIINIESDIEYKSKFQLDDLLKTFDLSEVKPYLTRAEITFESLKYLSKEDIKEAIPPIGLRACFREKLFIWRKSDYGIDDDTLSETIGNKVVSWLQTQYNVSTTNTPTSSLCISDGSSKLSKSLKLILEESLKGKSITSFYEKNFQLTDTFRGDLINIILEDIEAETRNFDDHYQSYVVGKLIIILKEFHEFTSPPLHLFPINNGKIYLRNKFL